MMNQPNIIFVSVLALILSGHVHLHSVNIHPERATLIVGEEVTINCDVEFGPNYEINWDFNSVLVYIFAGKAENYPHGTSKYFVHRTGMNFALTVKDLSLRDGGEYRCTSFTSEATAFLIVLDTPSVTLNPPAPVEGERARVTCKAFFGGPRKDLIIPEHYPNLKMSLEDTSSHKILTAKKDEHVKEYSYMTSMTKNLTFQASMNSRHITCEIGTTEPLMKTSSFTALNVLYSVRNLQITPVQETYEVGDNITCIADSNPASVYEWKQVQGGTTINGQWLKISDTMIGENPWECVARNLINGGWFEERMQQSFVRNSLAVTIAVDPTKSGNGEENGIICDIEEIKIQMFAYLYLSFSYFADNLAVVIAVVIVSIIIVVIIAVVGLYFWKRRNNTSGSSENGNANSPLELESVEAAPLMDEQPKTPQPESLECIKLLRSVQNKLVLDQHGKEILRVLKEDGKSILENDPNILNWLIMNANKLIESEYYADIIKVIPHESEDSPLKNLLQLMRCEENNVTFLKNEDRLLSVIQSITKYGDVQYRTECLKFLILNSEDLKNTSNKYKWSTELLTTLKVLLETGADPTRISPGKENQYPAQILFFSRIFYILWVKNELHESLLHVLPLMLSNKCTKLFKLPLLSALVQPHWDYITTNYECMPTNFFHQFKYITREILKHDETVLDQKNVFHRTPLLVFLKGIKLDESIFNDVSEIIQLLQSPVALSAKDVEGQNALHHLAKEFPVIQGQVTQKGRESFMKLVKSLASESNVSCQDKRGQTALHILARKFPGEISEQSGMVYHNFIKELATHKILEKKDCNDRTALHILVENFTFKIPDNAMETFLEVTKCLAVPSNISIQDSNGHTALQVITIMHKPNNVPEHFKNKFQEIVDVLSAAADFKN